MRIHTRSLHTFCRCNKGNGCDQVNDFYNFIIGQLTHERQASTDFIGKIHGTFVHVFSPHRHNADPFRKEHPHIVAQRTLELCEHVFRRSDVITVGGEIVLQSA